MWDVYNDIKLSIGKWAKFHLNIRLFFLATICFRVTCYVKNVLFSLKFNLVLGKLFEIGNEQNKNMFKVTDV